MTMSGNVDVPVEAVVLSVAGVRVLRAASEAMLRTEARSP